MHWIIDVATLKVKHFEEYGFTQALDFIGVDKIVRTEAGFFGQRDKTVQGYYLSLDMSQT